MGTRLEIEREVTAEERELLRVMAEDVAAHKNSRKRARAILAFIDTEDVSASAERSGVSPSTVRSAIHRYNEGGWQNLLYVPYPRGGDFLARYDQGYWAERLARRYLDRSCNCRAIPYGTSRSEPFTDRDTFREYAINEFLLQAWSAGKRWKRPDLLLLPRKVLRERGGHDEWTPDLMHWDNERCEPFVHEATAVVEVETSLWEVHQATVSLSFTVKEEDLEALRAWVAANNVPLYILQVFYDVAYVLPFTTLEYLISADAPEERRVQPKTDRTTSKATYMIPLEEGTTLGSIPEPNVEGRVWKADNGKVTVYGRLVGSEIAVEDAERLQLLADGRLGQE